MKQKSIRSEILRVFVILITILVVSTGTLIFKAINNLIVNNVLESNMKFSMTLLDNVIPGNLKKKEMNYIKEM